MRRITPCKENDSTSGVQPDNGVGSGRINPNVLNSGPHISVEVVTGRCANSGKEKRRKKTLCYEESFSISFFPPPLCSGVPRGGGFGVFKPPPPKFRSYRWSPRSHEQEEPASRFPFVVHCVLIRL